MGRNAKYREGQYRPQKERKATKIKKLISEKNENIVDKVKKAMAEYRGQGIGPGKLCRSEKEMQRGFDNDIEVLHVDEVAISIDEVSKNNKSTREGVKRNLFGDTSKGTNMNKELRGKLIEKKKFIKSGKARYSRNVSPSKKSAPVYSTILSQQSCTSSIHMISAPSPPPSLPLARNSKDNFNKLSTSLSYLPSFPSSESFSGSVRGIRTKDVTTKFDHPADDDQINSLGSESFSLNSENLLRLPCEHSWAESADFWSDISKADDMICSEPNYASNYCVSATSENVYNSFLGPVSSSQSTTSFSSFHSVQDYSILQTSSCPDLQCSDCEQQQDALGWGEEDMLRERGMWL